MDVFLLQLFTDSLDRVDELEKINAHLAASPGDDYKKAMEEFNKSAEIIVSNDDSGEVKKDD